MSILITGSRPRDALPPIIQLESEKLRSDRRDMSRYAVTPNLSITTIPLESPTAPYPGPPPPYSSASSAAGSNHGPSGYISPPESTTRRSTRDEKDSPSVNKSLPSISEALGDRSMIHGPLPPSQPPASGPLGTNSAGQTFHDAPRGPLNPFSQTGPIPSTNSLTEPAVSRATTSLSGPPDVLAKLNSETTVPVDTKSLLSKSAYPVSPRSSFSTGPRHSISQHPANNNPSEVTPIFSPYQQNAPRMPRSYPEYGSQPVSHHIPLTPSFSFEANAKPDDSRNPFNREAAPIPYGETVKRHLDIYDAEVALGEVTEGSNQTLQFSRFWAQRCHQSNRSDLFAEGTPDLREIEEMMRQSQRVMEGLSKIRQVIVMHQTALSEERARSSRPSQDEYHSVLDDYKLGGFAGGDAKKRRGKAAPPGRCHSCNRAETPEWRRGPDGARTLCNACGLHYAKLTRKLGQNKNNAILGSNLRPKSLDPKV